jgi:hypothetical protein
MKFKSVIIIIGETMGYVTIAIGFTMMILLIFTLLSE